MFDLDCATIPIECPSCSFYNSVTVKQVRLHDVVICRGCKSNLHLVDFMGTVSNARNAIRNSLTSLVESLLSIPNITVRF